MLSGHLEENCRNASVFERNIAQWFAGAHKYFFGNGPQGVVAGVVDNYVIITANKVLNKFERSLRNIPEGSYRIQYTRNLLFLEVKEEFKAKFENDFTIPVKDVRYSLNVELDKSICILILS